MNANSRKLSKTNSYRQTLAPSIPALLTIQLLMLIHLCTTLGTPAQAASHADMTKTQKALYGDMVHPILKVKLFEQLNKNTTLNESIYRQLNNLNYPEGYTRSYELRNLLLMGAFREAESQAARAFCQYALGRKQAEIEKAVGQPEFVYGKAPYWEMPANATANSFYSLGYLGLVNTRLSFADKKCIAAELTTPNQLQEFGRWRQQLLGDRTQLLVGKTIPEILTIDAYPRSHKKGESPDNLYYDFFRNYWIEVVIENGRCAKVNNWATLGKY